MVRLLTKSEQLQELLVDKKEAIETFKLLYRNDPFQKTPEIQAGLKSTKEYIESIDRQIKRLEA